MSDVYQESLQMHRKFGGKLGVQSLVSIKNKNDLSLAYTPGVAEPCRVIAKDKQASFDLTSRGRVVAVISDGSAVLGLGNIGPEASLPVMEGKSLLLKEFAGVDSIPLVIDTQDTDEIIKLVKQVAPSFAGINLEDISAPRCFEIEDALQDLGIPVFHDDQHGTAIVVMAALQNAAKVVGKNFEDLKVVIVGAGAAGLAVTRILLGLESTKSGYKKVVGINPVADVIVVDSKGALVKGRAGMNSYKKALAEYSNKERKKGSLAEVVKGADVILGVSSPGLITPAMIKSMANKAIVFAMANPTPEIMPDLAKKAGAAVVATGRSDFPNQINNVLAFPAIFKAALRMRAPRITMEMKIAAAEALAKTVTKPTANKIIPGPFEPNLAAKISQAIINTSS